MAKEHMTISVDNSFPVFLNAITDDAGGTWPAGTYNFIVAAWHVNSEADADNAGVQRTPAALANWIITLGSGSRKIDIDWTASDRVPNHYSVYYQTSFTHNITAVNQGIKTFTVAGNHAATINNFTSLSITGTNTGTYTLVSASNNGGNTDIVVSESIPTSTVDGAILGIINLDNLIFKVGASIGKNTTSATILDPNIAKGTVTTPDANGITLTDSTATFQTDNIIVGDFAVNVTDGSEGLVESITSETVLVNAALTGGGDDQWGGSDAYEIQRRATLGAAVSSVVVNPILNLGHQIRNHSVIGYNGKNVKKAFATNSVITRLIITMVSSSLASTAKYHDLMTWTGNSIDIKVVDGDSSALIQTYRGRIQALPDWLGSLQKNSNTSFNIIINVESTSTI